MENNNLTQDLPENKTGIIGRRCTYVIDGESAWLRKVNLFKWAKSRAIERYDRMERLAGQQPRTIDKKIKFIEVYSGEAFGNITRACRLADIKSRRTVYNWLRDDPNFKAALEDAMKTQYEFMMDLVKIHVLKGDKIMLRWWLSRFHPDFMTKKGFRATPEKGNAVEDTGEKTIARIRGG